MNGNYLRGETTVETAKKPLALSFLSTRHLFVPEVVPNCPFEHESVEPQGRWRHLFCQVGFRRHSSCCLVWGPHVGVGGEWPESPLVLCAAGRDNVNFPIAASLL